MSNSGGTLQVKESSIEKVQNPVLKNLQSGHFLAFGFENCYKFVNISFPAYVHLSSLWNYLHERWLSIALSNLMKNGM
jgi:hypothetical protein